MLLLGQKYDVQEMLAGGVISDDAALLAAGDAQLQRAIKVSGRRPIAVIITCRAPMQSRRIVMPLGPWWLVINADDALILV